MQNSDKVALVVVDHGSRAEASNASLEVVVREIAALAGERFLAVLPAHMELAVPSIADAFDSAVARGADFVVVALYFLAPGRHCDNDVPRLAAEAAARHPGLRFTVASSLGPHAALSALVLERASDALLRARS
ncbi:MAG: CbiX/SirB N-terminal domain-containing protein [Candidatus Binatia bacterium]